MRKTAVSSFAIKRGWAEKAGVAPSPTTGEDVPSCRPAIAYRGVIVCVAWTNHSVAPTLPAGVSNVSWITSPEIFV